MHQKFVRLVSLIVLLFSFVSTEAAELGDIPDGGFRSPEGDPRFAPEAGVRPLNNLVFELLNVESPGTEERQFRNPRDGWLYIKVTWGEKAASPVKVQLDDGVIELREVEGQQETMVFRKAGPHAIRLEADSNSASRLEVRAVGDLVYATYGMNPHIKETGHYAWDFLKRHCLNHYNGILGVGTLTEKGESVQEAEIREWTSQGKRWYTVEPVPYEVSSADECFAVWANSLGMQHPLMSGIWADEFGVGEKYGRKTVELYPFWTEALQRLQADPRFADRTFYSYIAASRLLPAESYAQMVPFLKTMMEGNYAFAPECYLPESRSRPGRIILKTEDLISEFSPAWEMASRESFEHAVPGGAANRVITMFTASEPGWETSDIYPEYDFNVFLDAQFQFIATDPAYFGVRGIQSYQSSYTGEEQLRLFARLMRHYAIEGKTQRLLSDPYVLPHLSNPDFTEGLKDWTIEPAVAVRDSASVSHKMIPGYGSLQARYHALPGTGDTVLVSRRSSERPNVISQRLKQLTPGRLYSLRFLTGNYGEFTLGESVQQKHSVSKQIEGVEVIPEKSFQAIVESGYWYPLGKFNNRNPYWLNYHQVVFRARGETAELKLLDWAEGDRAGGPEGEEYIWNFIQVQPYVE